MDLIPTNGWPLRRPLAKSLRGADWSWLDLLDLYDLQVDTCRETDESDFGNVQQRRGPERR